MKNWKTALISTALLLMTLLACKEKEKEDDKGGFIPVQSIIKGQLRDIDTSLYVIIKVNYKENMPVDTEYIKREDVHLIAKDFLDLPELTKKRYKEENIPGPTENLSTISYRPIQPEKEEVQEVDLVINPVLSETGQNVIKTIYISRSFSNRDSAVVKKLLWSVDRSFQVTTILQKKGQPESTNTFKLIWNEDDTE